MAKVTLTEICPACGNDYPSTESACPSCEFKRPEQRVKTQDRFVAPVSFSEQLARVRGDIAKLESVSSPDKAKLEQQAVEDYYRAIFDYTPVQREAQLNDALQLMRMLTKLKLSPGEAKKLIQIGKRIGEIAVAHDNLIKAVGGVDL